MLGQPVFGAGYSRADLGAGRVSWERLTPPAWRETNDRALRQMQSSGAAAPWETAQMRRDGSIVPMIMGGALVETGRGNECIAFVLDISDRKKAEEAL